MKKASVNGKTSGRILNSKDIEIRELRARLEEAEDTLRAIRSGEVDALVVCGDDGGQIYTLKGADEPYRVIVQTMGEGACTLDADGTVLYCNRRLSEMLKLPIEQIIGSDVYRYIPLGEREVFASLLSEAGDAPAHREAGLWQADGGTWPVRLSASPLVADGARHVCMIVTDLTERKRVEEELRLARAQMEQRVVDATVDLMELNTGLEMEIEERAQVEEELRVANDQLTDEHEQLRLSEERFRLALKNAPVTVATQDRNLRFTWAYNHRTATPEQIIGRTDSDLFTPEEVDFLRPLKRRLLETGEPVHEQLWLTRPGRRFCMDLYLDPLRDTNGEITGIGIATVDLTELKLAEEAMRTSEERYRGLFDTMTEGFSLDEIICDAEGKPCDLRYLAVNPAFEQQTGLKAKDIVGHTTLELFPDAEPIWFELYGKVALTGEPAHFEQKFGPLGRWFDVRAFQTEPGRFAVMFMDVTERREAEEKLKFHADVLANIHDAVFTMGTDLKITSWNKAAEDLYGWTAEEAMGRISADVVRTETPPYKREEWIATANATGHSTGVLLHHRKDGSPVWIDASVISLRDGAGRITGYAAANRDVTARKLAEENVARYTSQLKTLIENISTGVALVDDSGRFTVCNPQFMRLFGLPDDPASILNVNDQRWSDWQVFAEDGNLLPVDDHPVRKAAMTGQSVKDTLVGVKLPSGGDLVWMLISATPLLKPDGSLDQLICTYRDISEIRRVQQQLRESEARFRQLADSSFEGLVIHDRGVVLDVNERLLEIEGRTREEVIGYPVLEYAAPESREQILESWRQSPNDGVGPMEWVLLRADGTRVPVESMGKVLDWHGRKVFIAAVRDITERKLAEEALRASQGLVHAIIEGTNDPVYVKDRESRILLANPALAKVVGAPLDRIIGHTDTEYYGDPKWGEILREHDVRVMSTGQSEAVEETVPTPLGLRTFLSSKSPYRDTAGNIIGIIGISRDITERKQMEEALRLSEELAREQAQQLEKIMKAVPGGIFIATDPACSVIIGNPGAYEILNMRGGSNVSQSALHPKTHWQEFKNGRPLAPEDLPMQRAVRGEEVRGFEMDIVFDNGESKTVHCNASPIYGQEGEITGGVAFMTDITERKQAEEKLRFQANILANIHDAVYATDSLFRVTSWNRAAEEMYGITAAEAVGAISFELLQSELTDEQRAASIPRLHEIGHYRSELVHHRRDGTPIWVDSQTIELKGVDGKLIGYAAANRDTTERKRLEEALRESEQLFRSVQENSLDRFTIIKPMRNDRGEIVDFTFIYQNALAARASGRSPGELVGLRMSEVYPGVQQTRFFDIYKHVAETGRPTEFEEHYNADGVDDWFRAVVTPVTGGVAIGTQVITERRQAEEALRESEERLGLALDVSLLGTWELDLVTHHAWRALRHDQIFGYESLLPDWTFEMFAEHVIPEDRPNVVAKFQRAVSHGEDWNFECRIRRADNVIRWIMARGKSYLNEHGLPVRMVGVVQDITERKQAEDALRESEERFRIMADSSPIMLWVTDSQGKNLFVNRTYLEFFNLAPHQAEGDKWQPLVHPDDAPAYFAAVRHATSERTGFTREIRVRRADGQWRWLSTVAEPRFSSNGEFVGHVGISPDITERKQAEDELVRRSDELERIVMERSAQIRKLERQRNEAEKQAAIGRMAARIAHEINNPLAGIKNSFLLVKKAIPEDFKHFEFVARIDKELDRIARIVRQMFQIYKPEQNGPVLFDVANTIHDVTALLDGNAQAQGVRLEWTTDHAGSSVHQNEDSVRQVLFTLIQNAIEASPQGGTVRIRAELHGSVLSLTVADQGCGIHPDVGARIFEPFFTTKSELSGAGLGLGLAIAKGIVEAMGGVLSYESEVGKGTTFQVILPLNLTNKEE